MADFYDTLPVGATAPPSQKIAITPSDAANVTPQPRALYVLTTGNLSVSLRDDTDTAAPAAFAVTAGQIIPGLVRRVWATGTTCTVLGLR